MPRFVILRHDLPPDAIRVSHWDLMFESEGVLRTWSLPRELGADCEFEAQGLADHRIEYLDYEGPVSGDRGVVSRWDTGEYELLAADANRWIVALSGLRLRGTLSLERQASQGHSWRVSFAAVSAAG